jgi:bifunctional non-homologous end joining protein LigD
MEQTTLYFRQGSSDKVYSASIEPAGDEFVVRFAYGRRGSTMSTGTKTNAPVAYADAKRIYDKLVSEKFAKGYTPGESGTPYQHTDRANAATGVLPMLLNPIDAEQAANLVADPAWAMQEKYDGRRMMIRRSDSGIEGINRKGLIVALPEPVAQSAGEIPGPFLLDGECMGGTLVVFDLLELHGSNYRAFDYRQRLFVLMQILPNHGPHLSSVETAFDTARKADLLGRLRAEQKEGVVFKRLASPYTPDRPASGGNALKLKFCETASFIVSGVNGKRSVSLGLMHGTALVPAGNVTIPANHDMPREGAVVEVRYLYAFAESDCIYQPVYLGEREDIEPGECIVAQLKYKPEAQAA